jgi:hypothetical protein
MSHTDNGLSLQTVWENNIPSPTEQNEIDVSVPPIRGMSIFSLAHELPIPFTHSGETRICSGAKIPPPETRKRRSNPCATFNGTGRQTSHIKNLVCHDDTKIIPQEPAALLVADTPCHDHFSIADSINAATASCLRPIGDVPTTQTPPPSFTAIRIEMIPLPQDYDLGQLSAWHEERQGHEPHTHSTTPVWLKRADGSWACAANTTWPRLFEPLLKNIEDLKQNIDVIRAKQLAGWSLESVQPS